MDLFSPYYYLNFEKDVFVGNGFPYLVFFTYGRERTWLEFVVKGKLEDGSVEFKDEDSSLKESSSERSASIPDCDGVSPCIHKRGRRLTEGCLLWVFGDELRDLEALTNAIRAKRWTLVSTKLSCLPFESYVERGISVMGVPRYKSKMNVFDVMMTLGNG